MQTPDPLPQPGAWIVTADGSLYEVARSAITRQGYRLDRIR